MKLKQFIFALAVMLSGFAISVNAQEAKIGTTTYGTLAEAVKAAAAGDEIVLLKNVTLTGGYANDPTAGLRIEKALTINGNKKTIDCGSFEHGIRVYITGSSKADVKFENVTIKNNNPYGRCIDMRTGKIALEVKSGAKLIAQGVNSQPLTIGGSSATYRVRVSNATIDAGETGYGIISFVRVTNNIEFSSSVKISGLAALYLKEGANNTTVTMGNGTYTGTNLNSAASGMFGAVVIEGKNNTITVNHEKAVIKAVAGNDANQAVQAAFLLKEGATGNKIQVTNANAQVLTEGAQAQWATVATDATNNVLINKGQAVNFAVEYNGYQFMDANEVFSKFVPQEKEATIKLLSDVALDETWTVAAGQNITLDLNGKTASMAYTKDATANHAMISNKGNLTIVDSSNGGKLSYTYAGANLGTTYAANTITSEPGSVLTVKNGIIENLTYDHATIAYAIDGRTNGGAGDVTVNIEGGVITSKRQAVRIFANSTTKTGTLNISNGDFTGRVIVQNASANANKAVLNITGGTFNANEYKSDVLYLGGSNSATIDINASVSGGTFNGEITQTNVKGFISGGTFSQPVAEAFCAKGYAPIELGNGTYGVQEGQIVALIGSAKYFSLADALAAAKDGETISLQWRDDYTPIAMNGSLYGKSVTITGTAKVDWNKGFLFVGRGGEGNATLTFNNANLTSASNSSSYGIHVSGREKGTNNKYDGTLVIKNSTIELDYLINRGTITLEGSALTVKNGFGIAGRPASETENNVAATATVTLNDGAKLVVKNHNGMGLGQAAKELEGQGVMNIDATSTFETPQGFVVTANGTMNLAGKAKVAGTLTNNGAIVLTNAKASLNSNECGNVTTNVANKVVSYNNGAYKLIDVVAKIGEQGYTSLQAAIDAVQNGETITLTDNVTANVTLTEKVGLHYTIDGAGKTMKGSINVKALSDTEDNRRITIQNISFEDETAAEVDFITSVETNHYPRLTIKSCTFVGSRDATDVAVRLKSSHSVVISECIGTGLHSFLQNTSGWNLTLDRVQVYESKGAFALGTVQGVTVKGSTIDVATYGIRMDANTYNNNAVIEDNNVTAFIPVVVRKVNTQSNVTITGENTFTAENTDGKWMVIGKEEYETNGALPAEVAGANVVVALNDENLSYTGIHGAGLAGKGTAEAPYLISNVAELVIFRNSVNAGSAKFSAPGIHVALAADIDLAGINWVGIGTATADHGFMGNFDGKNFKIKNLTIDNPALDSDGYAYAGLFGVTEGTDKDNQNTIKNLTIENVTINTTGDIVSAAIAYPYYTNVDNVKVCGDIKIQGGKYTAGALAYTRRCVNASNLSIVGNDGSYVKGTQTVGGVISDIQMNGGLTAVYSNFSAEGITVTGEKSVGGIAGIIATQTLNGATVKNVTLSSQDEFAGVVAGRLGGTSTISNVVSENVTGATAVIGATYDGAKAVEARIGDTYYSAFAAAYTAAKANETVTLLADLNMSEILVLDKAITLDGNGKTLTSTAGRAINVDCEGNVGIKNLTINASGERAINVIQKPAKVTIEGVTATAANYTVNVASSAPKAVVTIKCSNLTGLNVVNVASPEANVTIEGGKITCNDQNTNENYAALALNKDAKGGKITATGVDFDIKGDSKKASNGAEGGEITIDGSTDEVAVNVAYISYGNNYYSFTTIEAAIAKANAGETVTLLRDVKASAIITIDKAITLDGNGKTLTSTAGRAINVSGADGVTIKNLTINATGERAINVIQNATNVTIDGVTATAKNYTVNVAASAPNAVVAIKNSTLNGLCTVNVSAAGAKVTVDSSTVNCNDNNTTAGESYAALSLNKEAVGGSIVATNSTINVTDGSDSMMGRNSAENGTVTINGSTEGVAVMVAVITYEGSDYYHSFASLAKAVEFAKAGDVVTLIRDVTVAQPVVINKSVTLDGNGKTLTYTGADRAIEMPNVADANYDVTIKNLNVVATTANRGLNYNDNGKLNVEGVTVTIGENVDGYAINFPGMADNAQVTIKDSKLTSRNPLNIWGENMTINVHNSEIISVDNSNTYDYAAIQLNNDNYGNVANGTTVNVYGGTITALNDNGEPSNAVANSTETGVVNISDETVVSGKVLDYVANIGGVYFGSLQAAVNAIEKYGYNSPIVIMKNFATSEATTIKSGLKVTINLNGKTITGTDNATGSFGLITNKGNLTINGEGAITLVATNDRDWNAYSSVISNTVGGKLTVNGGTIEHLGGTDMAYAIDNLTNGKGTYAETIINGGAVKSTYRAIRQFLNGVEAENILTVNGGTIEGTNKSIWMQDPSKNSNTGTLTVAADAKLTGDVYLSVTAGSTEWPVEVAVAAAALQGESKVLTSNVPAGYDLANVNGIYGIYSGAAKIGTTYYETVDAAIKAAKAGETVNILAGTYPVPSMKAGITVEGAVNADGTPAVLLEGTLSNTLENLTLKNLHIKGGNAQRWAYAKGDLFFENVTFEATSVYALHFDGIAAGTNLTYKNCTIIGWAAMGGTPESCVFDGCTIKGNGSYGVIRTYFDAEIKDCTFDVSNVNTNDAYQDGIHAVDGAEVVVDECTNVNGTMKDLVNISGTSEVTVDGVVYKNVAKVADKNYITIEDAFAAWADGTTLTLLTDIALNTKTLATQNDGYAAIINVADKAVTLDLNGKNITVDAAASDLASAKGGMLLAVFSADLGGHLTLTDNTEAKNGAVTLNVNDAKVYSMFVSESKESDKSNSGRITVNGGKYTTVGKVANAMFFTDANEVITVNGGNFHCDGATTTTSYPWMFNTNGNNELHVTVNGGTFNVDVNHQHRPFEVKVPETLAVKANGDGTWTVVAAEAYITEMLGGTVNEAGEWGHEVGYATIAEAIAAVNELGNKVSIAKDLELTEAVVVPADKTVVLDLNGKTVTMNDASGAAAALLKNNGNLTIMDGTEAKAGKLSFKTTTPSAANAYASNTISNYGVITIESGNVENLSVGGGACYALDNYAGSTATINGGKLTAEKTAVRIFNWTNGEEAKATINMNGGEIYSKNDYGINVNSGNAPFVALNITGGTITTDYADYKLAVYVVNKGTAENFTANVTGGTFNGIFALNGVTAQTMKQGAVAVSGGTFEGVTCYDDPAYGFVSGGTFKSAVDAKAVATGFICKDYGNDTFGVIVDPKHGKVAQIIRNDYYAENQYFATINDAVKAAQSGETVTLIADVETSAAGYATVGEEEYAVIVAVKEKDITLNLNGKSVTVTPTAEELENANGKMLMSVFGMDTNGKLTLTGNGSVKVNANGANVYSLVAAYGEGSAVVIENGNYEADAVTASGSLIYSHEMITVMGGTFNLGNLASGANGSPWIFNTIGQNYTGVKVVGGTYPTDINHQFWANEVLVPEAYALKNNGDGTWTVVDAVAYTNEKATSRGASWRHVGYASLEDAIAATGKYNCQDNTVTMIKDITLEPITIANGVKVAIDLNGKTISGTDNGTASFGLINNKGDLTINGTGAITLTATQDRGWSAYSSVISNQPGGKLTVNGGTIQHLGGTSMAWGIDNLTNGKSTYAETVINGGVVKSKYIAIRQFLNGVEAKNILTVNGGTLEGETASLYFQDPSKNANTGTLNVLDGTLAGDVYLDVTAGSTEWPVEVYIAKAALGQNVIHAENVPADAAALVEYDTFWQVEQKNLAALTIEDACEEYINKIEKNVGVLTYERYFDDTEWQTIVLPFDVPVANLTDQFEVAYIYNASYKGKEATIDYVVIKDPEFVLAANYPYLIKAKATGWNNIVVNKAKLMPTTEVETLDCSSIFEKFSFIGNYATVAAPSNDGMGYFNLTSGGWNKMETVNPFRFYMQIKLRKGGTFEYPDPATEAQAFRMRRVDENGNADTTGIDGVEAENAGDFIFDLHGRRVLEPLKGGLYIINGKKVIF